MAGHWALCPLWPGYLLSTQMESGAAPAAAVVCLCPASPVPLARLSRLISRDFTCVGSQAFAVLLMPESVTPLHGMQDQAQGDDEAMHVDPGSIRCLYPFSPHSVNFQLRHTSGPLPFAALLMPTAAC